MLSRAREVAAAMSLLGAVGTLAGCTDREGGQAGPVTSSSPVSSQVAPSTASATGVAPIAKPLDPTPFLRRPCDLVAKSALAEMGFTEPGEPDTDSKLAKDIAGPSCGWRDRGNGISIVMHTVNQKNGNGGLVPVYDSLEVGLLAFVDPVEVPGHPDYPAVEAGENDERSKGDCPVYVGIRDDLVFVVQSNYFTTPATGCSDAKKMAAAVLDTLKGES